MGAEGFVGALRLVSSSLARGIRLVPPVPFDQWLPKNIVLVDGEFKGEPWSAENAPYLVEIAQCLSQENTCNRVTVRKSQQSGMSILAMAWCLYIADQCPNNTLYGVPGREALRDMNSQKLSPLINAWQEHIGRRIIAPTISRSGEGSTTFEKNFPDGYVYLGNANSVMDFSGRTSKFGVKDEVSKWQDTPQGDDPEDLFEGRFTAFRRFKSYKILELSTPEIDSGDALGEGPDHCRIDRSFRRSDQRYWNITCPECQVLFYQSIEGLRIDEDHPHKSNYECPGCGHRLSENERVIGVRAGEWINTLSGYDRHPGFHIDAFISLMMSYEAIAEDKIKAERKGEKGKKNFTNLVLALAFEMRGDAPDHERLMERREADLKRNHIPPGVLILVGAADVQMRGIWYQIIGYGCDRQRWVIDAGYLDGDTDDPNSGAFEKLDEVYSRKYPDAYGNEWGVDGFAVDAGYRSHVVYSFVRTRPLMMAVKGVDGWHKPAIGLPTLVDIDLGGKRIRKGCKLYGIGTWSLKVSYYSDLRKIGVMSGEPVDPPGYCHHGTWLDDVYFKQITDEYLSDERERNGKVKRVWKPRTGENHLLDCSIYADALAEFFGMSSMSDADWIKLKALRNIPTQETDLFSPDPVKAQQSNEKTSDDEPEQPSRVVKHSRADEIARQRR